MEKRQVTLKIYTDEEIELFLAGGRREVDRLLLTSINHLALVLIPHLKQSNEIFEALGGVNTTKPRAAWIDAQIKKQERRSVMMQKVIDSGTNWVLLAFLGFIALIMWEGISTHVKNIFGVGK